MRCEEDLTCYKVCKLLYTVTTSLTFTAGMIWPISSCFLLSHQLHNSPDECARELFKPSKDSASLRDCNEKIFSGFGFFVSDVVRRVVLGLFGPLHLSVGPNR